MKYELSELVDIIGGGTPKTSVSEYWNGNIPWISVKDFNNDNRYVYETEKSITQAGLDHSSTKVLSRDDIIISARGTVGELAMISKPMAFNQSCYGIRAKKSINNTFLYYLLKNSINRLKLITHGSVFDTITRDTFSQIEIDLPSLETQKQIASILSALDNKIEQNNQINENLELQAQAIFEDMFPNVTYGEHSIGEYITPKRGKGLLSKNAIFGDVPVVAGGLEPATYHNTANTTAPVLTISASGANSGYVNLWTIPVWSSDSSFIDSSMTNNVYFWYVMLKIRQQEIYDSQTGSAQPHIYPKHISVLPITKLNEKDISNFTQMVTPMFDKIGKNKYENKRLAELRDTLLPKLMNGEIDVSEVKI